MPEPILSIAACKAIIASKSIDLVVQYFNNYTKLIDNLLSKFAKSKIKSGFHLIKNASLSGISTSQGQSHLQDAIPVFVESIGMIDQIKKQKFVLIDRQMARFGLCICYIFMDNNECSKSEIDELGKLVKNERDYMLEDYRKSVILLRPVIGASSGFFSFSSLVVYIYMKNRYLQRFWTQSRKESANKLFEFIGVDHLEKTLDDRFESLNIYRFYNKYFDACCITNSMSNFVKAFLTRDESISN